MTATAGDAAASVEHYLGRIESLNPTYRAYTTVDTAGARQAATESDRALAEGRPGGLLHGLAIAVKDNIDTAGLRAASGSRLFADHIPNADAPVAARLREAGAIVLGKAAMMELAFGIRSFDQIGGQCRNPFDPAHVPGGSSGGSAVAVALDLCDAALGTDTGGSVRIPAAFCGVTGLRPTHGLVPNRGVFPVSASFDTVGPMARRIEDVARLLFVMAGFDAEDPTSVDRPLDPAILRVDGDVAGLRIAMPRNFYFADLDPEVEAAVRAFAETLEQAGAIVTQVHVDGAEDAHLHATTMILADACALHAEALDSKADQFSPQVRERMIRGRERSGVDYARAVRFREAWRKTLRDLFRSHDVLLMPSSPSPAPLIEDGAHLADATRNATRFSYGGGLAGIPGLALPCGATRAGLPIGVTLEAAWWNEAALIRAGKAWQSRTDWHLRRPPIEEGARR